LANRTVNEHKLTVKQGGSKVDTHVAIPTWITALHDHSGDVCGLNLINSHEDSVLVSKADNDLRHTQKERLYPVLHQLAVEIVHVSLTSDLGAGFELHPVYRCTDSGRSGIPYCTINWLVNPTLYVVLHSAISSLNTYLHQLPRLNRGYCFRILCGQPNSIVLYCLLSACRGLRCSLSKSRPMWLEALPASRICSLLRRSP
jgi:hypothetical protein